MRARGKRKLCVYTCHYVCRRFALLHYIPQVFTKSNVFMYFKYDMKTICSVCAMYYMGVDPRSVHRIGERNN
jgi:hypothetical protein